MTAATDSARLAFKGIKTPGQNARAEIGGFWGAEVAGGITTVGAMYLMQQVPAVIMDPLSCALGKVLEPIQVPIEKGLGAICHLDECKPDAKKPVSQRAKDLARIIIISAPAVTASWFVKFAARRKLNKMLGVPDDSHGSVKWWEVWKMSPEEKMIFMADEGMHTVAMAGAQMGPLAPCTDRFIHHTKESLKKTLGWSDAASHEVATMVALHEIPNVIAAATAGAVIAGRHHYNWPSGWVGKILGKKPGASFAESVAHEAGSAAHVPGM